MLMWCSLVFHRMCKCVKDLKGMTHYVILNYKNIKFNIAES